MTTRNLEKMLRLTTLSRVCLLRYIGYWYFKSIELSNRVSQMCKSSLKIIVLLLYVYVA